MAISDASAALDFKTIRKRPDSIRGDLAKRSAPDKTMLLEDVIRKDREWRDDQKLLLTDQRDPRNELISGANRATSPAESSVDGTRAVCRRSGQRVRRVRAKDSERGLPSIT